MTHPIDTRYQKIIIHLLPLLAEVVSCSMMLVSYFLFFWYVLLFIDHRFIYVVVVGSWAFSDFKLFPKIVRRGVMC